VLTDDGLEEARQSVLAVAPVQALTVSTPLLQEVRV